MADEKKRDDGGPAFPCADSYGDVYSGMSLRDYFAAQAMSMMPHAPNKPTSNSDMAKRCYLIADAMLAERGQ